MISREIIVFQIFLIVTFVSGHHHHTDSRHYARRQDVESNAKNSTLSEGNIVRLSVFYETLCPASVEFFTSQLRPVTEKLGSRIDVHLVPYGHAKTKKSHRRYRFSCQHGPAECYGNKLHACAIAAMHNNTRSVLLNACLMQYTVYKPGFGYDYGYALNWCGYDLDIAIGSIRICLNSDHGNRLLKSHGDETHRLSPDYVPYVLINDSPDNQDEATGNLMSTICHMLTPTPTVCI